MIVNKSTVPIGSGDWVRMIVLDGVSERQKETGSTGTPIEVEFDVVSNPNFYAKVRRFMTPLIPIGLC